MKQGGGKILKHQDFQVDTTLKAAKLSSKPDKKSLETNATMIKQYTSKGRLIQVVKLATWMNKIHETVSAKRIENTIFHTKADIRKSTRKIPTQTKHKTYDHLQVSNCKHK